MIMVENVIMLLLLLSAMLALFCVLGFICDKLVDPWLAKLDADRCTTIYGLSGDWCGICEHSAYCKSTKGKKSGN